MSEKTKIYKRFFSRLTRINREETEEETRQEILHEVNLRGANLWLLFFTMLLACVGLSMDSPYALIGAMLMSPLMAPVIGLGFGFATNDVNMVNHCAKNWLFAFFISLLASTLYFLVSPFEKPTSSLLSFSHPTIYDVMVAFFGGLAAFIGLTRMEGMKVLAGVAVATACMPPLSTAGYGIAHLDWEFILGGSYFYIINCVYIGMGVMLLARYMRFKKRLHFREKPLSAKIVYILAIASFIPASIYAWRLMEEKKTSGNIERFVADNFNTTTNTVLKTTVEHKLPAPSIDIYLAGDLIPVQKEDSIRKNMNRYDLKNYKLILHQSGDVNDLVQNPEFLKKITVSQEKKLHQQDSIISALNKRIDSMIHLRSGN